MDGLTYDTRSQAEDTAEALRIAGEEVVVVPIAGNRYRVYKVDPRTIPQRLGEQVLKEKQKDIAWQKFLEETEAEEAREVYKEQRKLPGKIAKRKLEVKKQQLEAANAKLERLGMEKGVITEVRDPYTYEVVDYTLQRRGIGQRAAETVSRKIPEAISELPQTGIQATGDLVAHTSKQIDVKRGMKASIPGQAPQPSAVIAWLPSKGKGYIGEERPAIGRMGKVDIEKVGQSYMEQPEALEGSALSGLPRTKRLTVNGQEDPGFATMPRIRKPKVNENII